LLGLCAQRSPPLTHPRTRNTPQQDKKDLSPLPLNSLANRQGHAIGMPEAADRAAPDKPRPAFLAPKGVTNVALAKR